MGLLHVSISSQNAVVPRKTDDLDQTLRKRLEILAPYLEVLAKVKETTPSSSSDHQILDTLYRLVEMTELDKLRAAEHVADWHLMHKDRVLAEMKGQK
jgi:hypothetical protein